MYVIKVMFGIGFIRIDVRMFVLYFFIFRYRYFFYSYVCFVVLVNGCNISFVVLIL